MTPPPLGPLGPLWHMSSLAVWAILVLAWGVVLVWLVEFRGQK